MAQTCSLCERPSCRPDEYEALCTRHYLLSVKAAEKAAQARFQAHIDKLTKGEANGPMSL